MKHEFNELKGGLNRLAEVLEVTRTGPKHQAGSDSLVTLGTFFRFTEQFKNLYTMNEMDGTIFGLGRSFNDESYMDSYMNITTQRSHQNIGELPEFFQISASEHIYPHHYAGSP